MTARFRYIDGNGIEQPLIRSDWTFPTDDGDFATLYNVAKSSAELVTQFHAKRAALGVNITPAEQAEAIRKGPTALDELYRARRALAERALAFLTLETLATREGGPVTGLRAIEMSLPVRARGLAKIEPWNPQTLAIDRWLLDVLMSKGATERTQFMLEMKDGQHSATARALLRTADVPELLPLKLAEPDLTAITNAVARCEAPQQMAALDELHHAAVVARATWKASVSRIAEASGLEREDLAKTLGASLVRYEQPGHDGLNDPHWAEFIGTGRRRESAPAPANALSFIAN